MTISPSFKISHILLDIEGTTTPITFVKDVLFPFAATNLKSHLEQTFSSKEAQSDIELLRKQAEDDTRNGLVVPSIKTTTKDEIIDSVILNVQFQMSSDRKTAALKSLQGHIWRSGFQSSKLKGEVYDDVPHAFRKWNAMGLKCSIYSSGSIEAQRLLFGHSVFGDLNQFLYRNFDITTSGNKRSSDSYSNIIKDLDVSPEKLLFLTDIYEEALAATEAGCQVCLMLREGNTPLPCENKFRTAKTFEEIEVEMAK